MPSSPLVSAPSGRSGALVPSLQELCELFLAKQVSVRSVLVWLEILQEDPVLCQCEVLNKKFRQTLTDTFETICEIHGQDVVEAALDPKEFNALSGAADARKQATKQMQIRGSVLERKAINGRRVVSAVVGGMPLADLQEGALWPPDLDPTQREVYLRDEDFSAAFKMSRTDFAQLAAWKQVRLKKQAGLF